MINVSKSFCTNCMPLNKLYQSYIKGNCYLFFHFRKCWYELISKSIWQLKLLFSPKINLAACLNSGIPFPYIFAPTLFTNFSVVIAILVTMAKMNVIYTFFLVCSICREESTYETRENVFYFTLKALFFL